MKLHGTTQINNHNHLEIGKCDTVEIVKEYGTPLYVMDEDLVRQNCQSFFEAFTGLYDKVRIAYAGKAFLNLAMCKIVDEEGLYLDVVSGGELYTAIKSDFPGSKIIFHGNNKTEDELLMALKYGVGRIVVDSFYELYKLDKLAGESKLVADIYLRISPGIEAHTHDYIKTGHIDSKFGFPATNGQAYDAVEIALKLNNLRLKGIHCHIGSQIFETVPYVDAAGVMMDFAFSIKKNWDVDIDEIDLGGGFGIYYTDGDIPVSKKQISISIVNEIMKKVTDYGLKKPYIILEPGRSIVGNAGTTLYKVGAIKDIPHVRKYVAVDGGMGDNIRPALYSAKYEAVIANRMGDEKVELVTIVGKCCESGDILIKDIQIPCAKEDDILAIFSTGAYGQSMSSNYNRIPKPAVILVKDGMSCIISKRETYDEVIGNDILPERFIKKK